MTWTGGGGCFVLEWELELVESWNGFATRPLEPDLDIGLEPVR